MLKLGCTLPNLTNLCLHKTTDAKFYPFTEGDKDLFQKKSRRGCWWSINRFRTRSSCWWNFYSKVYKHMQIYCWDWRQPTISLLDVSTHAYRSLYALGFEFRNEQVHTSTKQGPQLWKYGHVFFPTNKTRMWNWKLLHNRQAEENWLLVLMGFVLIATLCLKPWVAFTTSVAVKSCVLLSLKRIFNVVARRESSMLWDDTIHKRKASKLLKWFTTRTYVDNSSNRKLLTSTLHNLSILQISMFVPYLDVFLIDSWDLNKQDKQI